MAKFFRLNNQSENTQFLEGIRKAIQSANINFLIGSGCGSPGIPPLGDIEKEIQGLLDSNNESEVESRIFQFLKPFLEAGQKMCEPCLDDKVKTTIEMHRRFLEVISQILFERKSNILMKQVSVFSTNYDLFIEKAFEGIDSPVRLNDGFRRGPSLDNCYKFSSSEYFNTVYNNGTVYNYEVELPSINLIKLHGSMSWAVSGREIQFFKNQADELLKEYGEIAARNNSKDIETFNQKFCIVLPTKKKLKDTLLNHTYYDLLRVYANALDRENTILIVEGFSFADEHLLEITTRALKNPTLKVEIFCYSKDELGGFKKKFQSFNNVEIVYSETEDISFKEFNDLLATLLPLENHPVKSENPSE